MICLLCLREAEAGHRCLRCRDYLRLLMTSEAAEDRAYGAQLIDTAVYYHKGRVGDVARRIVVRAA